MKKIINVTVLEIIILIPLLIITNKCYAATFENYTEKYNDTYIVPYGKEVYAQLSDGESIITENTNIAEIVYNKIRIIGIGDFSITVKNNDNEETINFFAWNGYLKNNSYKTYDDVNRKKVFKKINSKVYLALSETQNEKTYIINDYISKSKKNNANYKEKYIKSYYSANNYSQSSVSNFEYSMNKDELESDILYAAKSNNNNIDNSTNKSSSDNNSKQMDKLIKKAKEIAKGSYYYDSGKKRMSANYYDCSSLVYRLYNQYFTLKNIPKNTKSYGKKYRIGKAKDFSISDLKKGDVLWRGGYKKQKGKKKKVWKGHVTIYIGNGLFVAAHDYFDKNIEEEKEISIYKDSPSKYTYVYRFVDI